MLHAEHTLRRLTHRRICLRKKIVQRLAVLQSLLIFLRLVL